MSYTSHTPALSVVLSTEGDEIAGSRLRLTITPSTIKRPTILRGARELCYALGLIKIPTSIQRDLETQSNDLYPKIRAGWGDKQTHDPAWTTDLIKKVCEDHFKRPVDVESKLDYSSSISLLPTEEGSGHQPVLSQTAGDFCLTWPSGRTSGVATGEFGIRDEYHDLPLRSGADKERSAA